ncbi:hypothetical protein CJ030_MR4G018542 [Morella rubra]|uniref:Uncharacterized protein n=1 Tax=Morella rubra TaxID=262757 RepID=A0A6A1VQB3_9ROSI|nr:hypothetical protein CJ030_MR4G018542 [Morella rubra]
MSGLFRKNGKIENWKPCLKMPAKAVTTNEIHSALSPVGRKHLAGSNLVSCCINQNDGVASTCLVVSGSVAKISPPNGEKYTSGVPGSLEGLECLLELSGDYDSHLRNLQYCQLCHGHALSPPLFPSPPMSPWFQSNPCEDVYESQQISNFGPFRDRPVPHKRRNHMVEVHSQLQRHARNNGLAPQEVNLRGKGSHELSYDKFPVLGRGKFGWPDSHQSHLSKGGSSPANSFSCSYVKLESSSLCPQLSEALMTEGSSELDLGISHTCVSTPSPVIPALQSPEPLPAENQER